MSELIFKCSNISKSFDQGNKTVEDLKNIDFTLNNQPVYLSSGHLALVKQPF